MAHDLPHTAALWQSFHNAKQSFANHDVEIVKSWRSPNHASFACKSLSKKRPFQTNARNALVWKRRRNSAVPLYLTTVFRCPLIFSVTGEPVRIYLAKSFAVLSAARGGAIFRNPCRLAASVDSLKSGFYEFLSRQCLFKIWLYLFYTIFVVLSTNYYILFMVF